MTLLPAAKAGAIFFTAINRGWLKGYPNPDRWSSERELYVNHWNAQLSALPLLEVHAAHS